MPRFKSLPSGDTQYANFALCVSSVGKCPGPCDSCVWVLSLCLEEDVRLKGGSHVEDCEVHLAVILTAPCNCFCQACQLEPTEWAFCVGKG